jgi:hypothetical protein
MLVIEDAYVIERLQALANQRGKSVEDVIRAWLDEIESDNALHGINSQTLIALVDQFAFQGAHPIDAEHADAILDSEFADGLLARMNDDPSTTPG